MTHTHSVHSPTVVRRAAFTLVELLVVIGIIALLISILLPALSKAREASTSAACLANLHSIGQANYAYATSNDGYAVPPGWRSGAQGGPYGTSDSWANIFVNGGYITAPDSSKAGAGRTKSAFYCPGGDATRVASLVADTVPASRIDNDGAGGMRYNSLESGTAVDCWYGLNASTYNGNVGSVPLIRSPADGDPVNNFRSMIKLSSIPRSSETVFVYDGLFMNEMDVNANRINARHGGNTKTNLLFFDGHAQSYETKTLPGGVGVAKVSDFSLKNLNANYPPPAPRWRMDQD